MDSPFRNICVTSAPARLAIPGFRTESTIFTTTLIDTEEYTASELATLYQWRWHIELDSRCVKQIMGMEMIYSKTPEMMHKDLWASILACNLIRKLMAQAAIVSSRHVRQLNRIVHRSALSPPIACDSRNMGVMEAAGLEIYFRF